MSMTREEAIDILENEKMCVNNETCQREECATCSLVMDKDKILTALDMALSALRPVSRERVEKVWRGCEKCNGAGEYSRYAENLTKILLAKYCPHCGRPLTDEAVDMVMERLEGME